MESLPLQAATTRRTGSKVVRETASLRASLNVYVIFSTLSLRSSAESQPFPTVQPPPLGCTYHRFSRGWWELRKLNSMQF